ncbi:MAG: peptidoglycan-binding protein, partial [Bacteroides sp.]|nr:peptidoglycan-binding protein [Bacteroides sp.]
LTDTNASEINLGDRILKKGMQGSDVTQLKNILIDKKYYTGTIGTGNTYFDEAIEKAVINFQKDAGVDADGIVGKQTADLLKK